MSTKIKHVVGSSVENGVEDFFSAFIFNRMREITKPFLSSYESESEFDEAMQSFINTLAMGMAIYALNKIMTFFFERGAKMLGSMYTYIIAGKLKKAVVNKIKNSSKNSRGGRLLRKVGFLMGADRTSERIEMMKIAQSNVDSFDQHKFHYENQHMQTKSNLDMFGGSIAGLKGAKDNKSVTLFTDLTFRGAWKNSSEHKKIYENATGSKLSATGQGSWNNLHTELNKFTNFHKTANDEVTNLATSLNKIMAMNGAIQ